MNRADTSLWYGDTDAGKTVQLGEVAQWEYSRTQGITRLISADSGWDPIEQMICGPERPLGMQYKDSLGRVRHVCVEAWNIQYVKGDPFAILIKLSEGGWPRSDETGTKVILKSATKQSNRILATDGRHLVTQVAIEGLNMICNMLMQDHIRNLRKIGQDIVGDFPVQIDVESNGKITSENWKLGRAAQSHYGQIQDFVLLDLVPRFASLPVSRVLWTAHEAKGDDDISGIKQSVLGPATIGRATVGRTSFLFGETFHFVVEISQQINQATRQTMMISQRKAYYTSHPDDYLNKKLWPAKLSLPVDRILDLQKRFPGGFVPLTLDKGGMDSYLEWRHFQDKPVVVGELSKEASNAVK